MRINFKKNRQTMSNLIAIIMALMGVLFKLYYYAFKKYPAIDYIGNILITSLAVGIFLELFLRRKEDVVLSEVLGIPIGDSLMQNITSLIKMSPYITQKRISKWSIEDYDNKEKVLMNVTHEDIHKIKISKDNCDFFFRRGYNIDKTKLKEILMDRKGNGKFKQLDYSPDYNQHLLEQKHGNYMCFTLTNLKLKKNFFYGIKIKTLFKECMEYTKDYLSVDFLNPTLYTEVIIDFPFSIKIGNKNYYHIDAKIRSLSEFKGYISNFKILNSKNIKGNRIVIKYDKVLDAGDSIVVYYKKI